MKLIHFRAAQSKWQPDLALVLLVLWGLFIVYATMLPFDFSATSEHIVKTLGRLWKRPLRGGSWNDVYSNVALFIPWGLLLSVWQVRRGRGYITVMIMALLSGALLSGSVEFFQMFAPTRTTSVIDLITNTFGSCVGALFGWPWARWVWPWLSVRIRQLIFGRPLAAASLVTLGFLMIAGLSPFHISLSPSAMRAALRGVQFDPAGLLSPRTSDPRPWIWVAELLTWILAGGLFALAAKESNERGGRMIGWAIAVAAGASLIIQASHVVTPERAIDLTSVLVALIGSAIGSVLVLCAPKRDPRQYIPATLLIWGVALFVAAWTPPRLRWPEPPYWKTEWLVPFWSYFGSRSLADLADVIGQALIFIPLGALLAARSLRQSFTGAVLIGLGLGLILEFGQAFLPRTADISDAISAAAGAGLGWGLWRWGESAKTSSMGVARYRVGRR
jgi:glycopeptide antibiotics resistance protein